MTTPQLQRSVLLCRWKIALVLLSLLRARSILVDVDAAAATVSDFFDKGKNEHELLEWIRSKGGYWNRKQELRYDETIPDLYGVFASEDIEEGALLASIPWDCVIYPNDNDVPDRFDDDCAMVKRLADEVQKHKDPTQTSEFSHYVEGLIQTATEHYKLLPAHWSEGGRDLLSEIIFDQDTSFQVLPPIDLFLIDDDWKHHCDATVDPMSTLLVMTHGEDFGMVPLTDKYNSRGGNWTGAFFSIENGPGDVALEIRALRSLTRGEQLFTDYRDYGQIGTPELLRDYGFVEAYPQRWIFPYHRVAFDVLERAAAHPTMTKEDRSENDDDDDDWKTRFEIQWHERIQMMPYSGKPSTADFSIENFRRQLHRLEQKVHPLLTSAEKAGSSESSEALPSEHELRVVRRFYQVLTTALELAIHDVEAASTSTSTRTGYSSEGEDEL